MKPTLQERLRQARSDKIPRGWIDINGVSRREGLAETDGRGAIHYIVKRALAAGLLEARRFRRATPSGLRTRTYYRYR